ncbi:MAG TPA: lipid kinase [Noviherbaspirillum sp.]|nr:lipid kinase [Noviherbaspirillum sp.]
MRRRALLIINRNSRSGAEDAERIRARLAGCGIEVFEPKPTLHAEICDVIRNHRQKVDMIVVGGGDGSLNAVAPALVECGLPLGVIPLGTANDLARTLSIPPDPDQACMIIGAGCRHRIDLGRVNGRYFFNVAHIGLGARVTHTVSGPAKRQLGAFAYFAALARALRSTRTFHALIDCDGRRLEMDAVQIAVGNGRYFGGGTTVAAAAAIDDGRFFLCGVEPLGWREVIRMALRARALYAGRFEERDPVQVEQGREIFVHTRRPMIISADGELVGRTPARFELLERAVEVFVPQAYLENEVKHVAQG